jgi:hypothetical protein
VEGVALLPPQPMTEPWHRMSTYAVRSPITLSFLGLVVTSVVEQNVVTYLHPPPRINNLSFFVFKREFLSIQFIFIR